MTFADSEEEKKKFQTHLDYMQAALTSIAQWEDKVLTAKYE